MALGTFFVGSDTKVYLENIKDDQGQFVNNATVVGTLKDTNGVAVVGVGPISFAYVSGSDGTYLGVVPAAAQLVERHEYDLFAQISAGGKLAVYRMRRRAIQLAV
jgi:hypothetical protein